jgi:MPBQ/MSBQ methyltransferase
LDSVGVADWTEPTIDSWRHSVWVGVFDPWIVVFKVGALT